MNLAEVFGARPVQKWQRGFTGRWDCESVTVGRLPDGRWYVLRVTQVYVPARAFADEVTARRTAAGFVAGLLGWREVPACFDARHLPVEPGWRLVGNDWVRDA